MADFFDDVGYRELLNKLGETIPTGASVTAVQVEFDTGSGANNLYLPNPNAAQMIGREIIDASRFNDGISQHAIGVANNFFGNTVSMTGGIPRVYGYESDDWTDNFLNTFSSADPDVFPGEVVNMSFISGSDSSFDDIQNENVLARLDVAIERDGVVAVAGLNNGSNNSHPDLMVSGYNSISVGRTSGAHSRGLTQLAGSGRMKPEIVSPKNSTSVATASVSSAAAFLRDQANSHASVNAVRPEVIKAILMAGATKEEFVNWSQSVSKPLDSVYGAGELNIYNSYHIMARDEQFSFSQVPGNVESTGWDYGTVSSSNEEQEYFFEVPSGKVMRNISILLTWHRDVTVVGPLDVSNLDNLTLRLSRANGFTRTTQLRSSESPVDNVEHIYYREILTPGEYVIIVSGPASGQFTAPYALAWRSLVHLSNTYSLWQDHALSDGMLDPADTTETGDPDEDDLSNLIEYALNLDPLVSNLGESLARVVFEDGNVFSLNFDRRRYSTDLRYEIGISNNLTDWEWLSMDDSRISITPLGDEMETVSVRLELSGSMVPRLFYRLRISDL